ncbi:MAG: hypothetical protein M1840_000458 [Geoglossum simile]|nr:MAG: hypothetical protein M1840_000458 [Geoglossum simile]
MDPPDEAEYSTRDALVRAVQDYGKAHGYAVTTKRDNSIILGLSTFELVALSQNVRKWQQGKQQEEEKRQEREQLRKKKKYREEQQRKESQQEEEERQLEEEQWDIEEEIWSEREQGEEG